MWLTRIAVLAIALLLGHDALMAAGSHGIASDHEHGVVVQCGPTDGITHQPDLQPTTHTPANVVTHAWPPVWQQDSSNAPTPSTYTLDASAIRVWLQVYLN